MQNQIDAHQMVRMQPALQQQIHIHHCPAQVFANTIIIQAQKLVPIEHRSTIITHPHPQNSIHQCPFSITNGKHIVFKKQIYKNLLLVIGSLSNRQVASEQQIFKLQVQIAKSRIKMNTILTMCQELAQLSTTTNENQTNPFWLFMNPVLKWRQHKRQQQRKQRQIRLTNLRKNGEMNTIQIIYKLQLIQAYYKELQVAQPHPLVQKFSKICLIALLKHLKTNNQNMYKASLQHATFAQIDAQMLAFLVQLNNEIPPQKLAGDIVYLDYIIKPSAKPKKQEEVQPFGQRLLKNMMGPLLATGALLIAGKIFAFK